MLLVGSAIRALRERTLPDGTPARVNVSGVDTTRQGHEYARNMGFWHSLGLEELSHEHLPPSGLRFVRIRRLSVAEMTRQCGGVDPIRSELVARQAAELATVLTGGKDDTDFWQATEYTIRELLRNAIEHSRSDLIWLAAAARPTHDDAQIAILDEGEGIRQPLIRSGRYSPATDRSAIDLALQPGVSRTAGRVLSGERIAMLREQHPGQDPYQYENSGYGLTITSQIARDAGQFAVVSGDASVAYHEGKLLHASTFHPGTALRIVLYPRRLPGILDTVFARAAATSPHRPRSTSLITASMMRRLGLGSDDPS